MRLWVPAMVIPLVILFGPTLDLSSDMTLLVFAATLAVIISIWIVNQPPDQLEIHRSQED
jgi:uncharacterized membrane protein